MGMATNFNVRRAPYVLPNGLMRCDPCQATWARGALIRGYISNEGTTEPPRVQKTGSIPDDECPWCGTKEAL